MNKKEFIEEVQTHCPPGLGQHVPMAIDLLEGIVKYEGWNVSTVIQFIPRMLLLTRSTKGEDYLSRGKLNAHALLTADYVAESLKPKIKAIRKAIFGSEEPPFSSLQEAEDWVNVYDTGTFFLEEEKARKWVSVFGKWDGRWEWVADDRIGEKFYGMTRAFWEWDKVENEILELSDKTGISPETLRLYVLADIKPLQTPYEISMPGQEYCKGRRKCWYVNIKVNTELSFEELLEIYHTVREALGGFRKSKTFNEKHLELYNMVQERGSALKDKGTVKFWKSLQQEWNERHKNGDEYTTWKGVKRAYDLIYNKLNALYQTEEADNEGPHSQEE